MHIMGEDNQSNMQEENGTEMERTEQVWFKLAYSESPISFRQQGATPHSKNNNKKIYDLFSLSRWCKQKTDALQNNNFGGLWNNFDKFVQASDESRLPGSDELSNRVMIFEHIVQLLSLISLSVLSALIICTLIFFYHFFIISTDLLSSFLLWPMFLHTRVRRIRNFSTLVVFAGDLA